MKEQVENIKKLKIYPTKEQFENTIQRDNNGRLIPESFYSEKAKSLFKEYRGNNDKHLDERDSIALYEHSLLKSLNLQELEYQSTENGIKGFNERLEIVKEYYQRYPEQIEQSVCLNELLNHPKYILNLQNGKYISVLKKPLEY